ncbi:MAG: radical SAM/SPASM domain-containing protein [Candidatus Sumerlaeaceae bacterium]|jgi:radical SAM protein with 4Fe4S-binding SPASM domain
MHSTIRRIGQWVKREHLRWRAQLSRGETVKAANAALNWKEFWQGRTRLASYPRHVQIGTNWTCNLKCNFCRLTLPETQQALRQLDKSELEISGQVLEEVLDLLPYPEMITLTPLGEPLLYSKLGRILERHRELGSHNLAMTTNANLIDDTRAQMLVEGGVAHLFVSVDAVTPDLYAQMRVLGSIEKVRHALEAINRWKRKLRSPWPTMTLASTFLERNLREMPQLLDFALEHGFETFSIQIMEIENRELEAEFIGHHVGLAREMLVQTLRKAEGLPIRISVNLGFRNLISHVLSEKERRLINQHCEGEPIAQNGCEAVQVLHASEALAQLSTRGKTLVEKCHYPWYFLLIDTDGDVRPCCWAAASWGNLNRRPLQEIWNSERAVEMRQNFLRNHIPKSCQGKSCRVELGHFGTLEE